MVKVTTRVVMFSLSLAAGVALTWVAIPSIFFSPIDGGPLDFEPRLDASTTSPDNELTVKIYRQRDPAYSRFVGADAFVQIYDERGRLLYRERIGHDGAWDELNIKYGISFDENEIRVARLWCPPCGSNPPDEIIRLSELEALSP